MARYRRQPRKSNRDFFSDEYKEWRRAVLERDGHKCQMPDCPRRSRKLEVHHIIRWVDSPHLRYVVNNGITLCRTCHNKIRNKEDFYIVLFTGIVRQNNAHRK